MSDRAGGQKTRTKSKQSIRLAGSTKIVTEFFEYSVNSILYQRGIYPPEDFQMIKKYGLTLLKTSDESLERYIATVLSQVKTWIESGNISRLVMAIISKETRETLERWQFDIHVDDLAAPAPGETGKENAGPQGTTKEKSRPEKTNEQIHKEIQDIIRQITASVTFLPSVEEKCVFNILVYTDLDTVVPTEWVDSDPHLISGNSEQVKLRSFSTNLHKVEALVAYRLGDGV